MDGGGGEEMGVKITPFLQFLKRNSGGGTDGWVTGKRGRRGSFNWDIKTNKK